ncbi:putative RNA-directed DNA polymerase [Helianthus annuus]|uniref:RNA-directed DNA polymerase n=1 Tax=Helianthus annuus TaxID=4232 RepID=A0A9K3IFQ9_HELAN|nr:putative RNA-directed DNA polymerase [Helianthus annuus]
MGESSLGLSKFFVSNLPDRCSSVAVGEFFSVFGNVARVYVARKRDKNGNNFGFVTFKGVKDTKDLEGRLKGIKMGSFKLQVNLARFAAENSGASASPAVGTGLPIRSGSGAWGQGNVDSLRDGRSYSDVLGKNKGKVSSSSVRDGGIDGVPVVRSVVVPDRISAFKELTGLAVIGRTVNLETLVDFDKLLRIAKVIFTRIQYLGGLFVMVSFPDEPEMKRFLDSRNVWGPWFDKLEPWAGQSLPSERVAWLKLFGIPLNLLDADVFMQVGELFGKVLFVPKDTDADLDLSVVKIGVLVGEAKRCNESVSLKWKNKVFRIWVEEELEDWVPDCVDVESIDRSESESPLASSPVADPVSSGGVEVDETQKLEGQVEGVKSSDVDGVLNEVMSHPLVHEDNNDQQLFGDSGVGRLMSAFNSHDRSDSVGPRVSNVGDGPFYFGLDRAEGISKLRAQRKSSMGSKHRKGQAQGGCSRSPKDIRPSKRFRRDWEKQDEGFGFVGFTDYATSGDDSSGQDRIRDVAGLDLNAEAVPVEPDGARVEVSGVGGVPLGTGGISGSAESTRVDEEVVDTVAIGDLLGVKLDKFSGMIKEAISKQTGVDRSVMEKFWGNHNFGMESVDATGLSGGLICLWDENVFRMDSVVKNRHFIHVRGSIAGCNSAVNYLNVYAPQGIPAKQALWEELSGIVSNSDGLWVIGGDFNAVRFREERRNCAFKPSCADNFNAFVYDLGLFEYNMSGRQFTWRSDNGKKMSKLDRFFVNSDFFDRWPEARVQALPRFWSDHCPVVLISKAVNFGPRPFRIFNSWLEKEGFSEVVENACRDFSEPSPSPDISLIKKLGFIRGRIREWRDKMIRKEGESRRLAESELEELEALLEVRELTEEEEWVMSENKKALAEMELAKCSDLRQRSRVRWAKEGDENSKFFHTMVNCRKASNVIHGLNIGNSWVSKPSLVKKGVLNFFRSKFVEDCVSRPFLACANLKKLSSIDASWLESEFSAAEIKEGVFGCGDDRAPGPDGFNFRFFKRFWHLFENDFVSIMTAFFESGQINAGCGSSFIALIPKVRDPSNLGDYRPISLVGVVNKVISKVLANRLKKVLGSVISKNQSAFLGDRFILDGPLIINEVCSWLKKSKKEALLFKIDFEKAYDNINWGFVIDVLRQMGFGDRWRQWIWGILSSARASVLVNGSPTFEFKCGKGMRQGDPISPFLFVVAMEALSCLFDKALELGVISGVQLPNDGPILSHLFFADDALIIGDWSKGNAINIVRILRCFHVCSGLRINLGKSSLFGIGVGIEEVDILAGSVGCKSESLPFKYLGLKVGANMNRIVNWRPVYDVFEARLALWKSSLLSLGGRVTLIRSVLASLPNYYFSLYRAPVKVIKDLERMMKKFLWGGSCDVRKTHWVAWERLSIPVKSGGLGICKLFNINRALLCKWGWRYKKEKDNLWVRVVDALHSGGSEWSFLPLKKTLGGVWASIWSVISKPVVSNVHLRGFFRGKVGRGDRIMFWLDPWLRDVSLREVYPRLFSLEVVKTCCVRDRMEGNWLWRHDPDSGEEQAELADLLSSLSSVSLSNSVDEWLWSPDSSGSFSVKSVKDLIDASSCSRNWYVMDRCAWVPLKCNIFGWRADMNRLPTSDVLRSRGIAVGDGLCPLCKSEAESVVHLFCSCSVASIVWQKISWWCRIPPIYAFSFRDLLEIHRFSNVANNLKSVIHDIIITTCWCLWSARNKAVFSGIEAKVESVFSEVRSLGFLWYKYRVKDNPVSWTNWCKFVNI